MPLILTRMQEAGQIDVTPRAAREAMQEHFDADPDFRRGYVDNVACILLDECGMEKEQRDHIADLIVRRVFE